MKIKIDTDIDTYIKKNFIKTCVMKKLFKYL